MSESFKSSARPIAKFQRNNERAKVGTVARNEVLQIFLDDTGYSGIVCAADDMENQLKQNRLIFKSRELALGYGHAWSIGEL